MNTFGVGPATKGKNTGLEHSQNSRIVPGGRVKNKSGHIVFDPKTNLITVLESTTPAVEYPANPFASAPSIPVTLSRAKLDQTTPGSSTYDVAFSFDGGSRVSDQYLSDMNQEYVAMVMHGIYVVAVPGDSVNFDQALQVYLNNSPATPFSWAIMPNTASGEERVLSVSGDFFRPHQDSSSWSSPDWVSAVQDNGGVVSIAVVIFEQYSVIKLPEAQFVYNSGRIVGQSNIITSTYDFGD